MIGKAERGPVAIEAIRKHGAAYLMAVGGAAYLVSKAIRGVARRRVRRSRHGSDLRVRRQGHAGHRRRRRPRQLGAPHRPRKTGRRRSARSRSRPSSTAPPRSPSGRRAAPAGGTKCAISARGLPAKLPPRRFAGRPCGRRRARPGATRAARARRRGPSSCCSPPWHGPPLRKPRLRRCRTKARCWRTCRACSRRRSTTSRSPRHPRT